MTSVLRSLVNPRAASTNGPERRGEMPPHRTAVCLLWVIQTNQYFTPGRRRDAKARRGAVRRSRAASRPRREAASGAGSSAVPAAGGVGQIVRARGRSRGWRADARARSATTRGQVGQQRAHGMQPSGRRAPRRPGPPSSGTAPRFVERSQPASGAATRGARRSRAAPRGRAQASGRRSRPTRPDPQRRQRRRVYEHERQACTVTRHGARLHRLVPPRELVGRDAVDFLRRVRRRQSV